MSFGCAECRKRFRTESALKMHNQAKHRGVPIRHEPQARRRRWWLWPLVLAPIGAAATVAIALIK